MIYPLNWFYNKIKGYLSRDNITIYLKGVPGNIPYMWHWIGTYAVLQISRPKNIVLNFELTCGPASHYDIFPFSMEILIDGVAAGKVNFDECEQSYDVCLQIPSSRDLVLVAFQSNAYFSTPLVARGLKEKKITARITNMKVTNKQNDEISLGKLPIMKVKYSHSRLKPLAKGSTAAQAVFNNRPCPVCGKNNAEASSFLGTLQPTRNLGKIFYNLLECKQCDLIFQNHLPCSYALNYIYSLTRQFDGADKYEGVKAEVTLNFFRNSFRKLTSKSKSGDFKMLEIGAGLSWMARVTKECFPTSLTVGQDVSGECVRVCSWVDHYIVGDLFACSEKIDRHGPYQLISMTHVIEHLADPVAYLRYCRKLLAGNGIIFVTAPHRPIGWHKGVSFSLWENWSYNHVPGHLQYFNRKSICKVADLAGLQVLKYIDSAENGQAFEAWLAQPSYMFHPEI